MSVVIVVVDLVSIQIHFRSRRPQAKQPLHPDGHTATGPAQDGHKLQARAWRGAPGIPCRFSVTASFASTVCSASAALGSRGEIQNEMGPLPRAGVVQQG